MVNPGGSKCRARRAERCKSGNCVHTSAHFLLSPSWYIPARACMYAQCGYVCMVPLVLHLFRMALKICVWSCRHTRCSCSVCTLLMLIRLPVVHQLVRLFVNKYLHASRPHIASEIKRERQGVDTSQRCRTYYQPHTFVYA